MFPPLHSTYATVGALRLHAVRARPDRPTIALPVVLVHGAIISGRYMRPTLRRVAREAECWAPDLPNHGRSETPPAPLDVAGYAEALVGWMDAVGLARAVCVGNSFGCQVLAHAAARHPARFAGIVLTGATVEDEARSATRQALRIARDAFRERFSLWLLELFDMLRVGPFRMVAILRATLDDRIEAVLPTVRVPVLVVRGEVDELSPQDWNDRLAALAHAPPPVVIPGAAHGLNYDAPESLARVVLDFARSLEAGTAAARRA